MSDNTTIDLAALVARLREEMRTAAGGTYQTIQHADLNVLLTVADDAIARADGAWDRA